MSSVSTGRGIDRVQKRKELQRAYRFARKGVSMPLNITQRAVARILKYFLRSSENKASKITIETSSSLESAAHSKATRF